MQLPGTPQAVLMSEEDEPVVAAAIDMRQTRTFYKDLCNAIEPVPADSIDDGDAFYFDWEEASEIEINVSQIAALGSDTQSVFSLSWRDIAKATQQDHTLSIVLKAIMEGTIDSIPPHDSDLGQLLKYKDSLHASDGVVMYDSRIVIPVSLRKPVLEILHSAHQG